MFIHQGINHKEAELSWLRVRPQVEGQHGACGGSLSSFDCSVVHIFAAAVFHFIVDCLDFSCRTCSQILWHK